MEVNPLDPAQTEASRTADTVARRSYGKLIAFLASRTRDVAAAEDALSEAFTAALADWPRHGCPSNPEAWLLTVARRRMIDVARRRRTSEAATGHLQLLAEGFEDAAAGAEIPDRRLALLFACAHPAIDTGIRAPLMLQVVVGLDAKKIASAFLLSPTTMGKRLVRAKNKIREEGIPFAIPGREELSARLDSVLEAIYAAFAEGWADPAGTDAANRDLTEEALFLARLATELLPGEPEALGLLALMLHAEARRQARRVAGEYVPLAQQDSQLWDSQKIAEAEALLRQASALGSIGRFQLEAALQSAHVYRRRTGIGNWAEIVQLYDALFALVGSPVIAINRALAIAEIHGASSALKALDEVASDDRLAEYQPYWAARAELLARSGAHVEAREAYSTAIGLERDPAIRRFLLRRQSALSDTMDLMTTGLENLEPQSVWKHFIAISAIPRASEKEAAVRSYVLAQAARLGLESVQDDAGNVVVRKPAHPGREHAIMAAVQGHLDMVCEKNEGTVHNFDTDPIRLVRDGDWLKADGTTLGADNGVGVAAALAVMESQDIAHGPLEFVFTIDEESGLTGATKFPNGLLQSKYFLNLDNEEENTLCIGCAGGVNSVARRPIVRRPAPIGDAWRIKIAGLLGGHSGVDIHRGRGNAVRILGRTVQTLMSRLPLAVAEMNGGSKRNAIPREAFAVVILDSAHAVALKSLLASIEAEYRADLGSFDPGLSITAERAARPDRVIADVDAALIAGVLASQHHGVCAMSPDIPGLVQTSTNLAIVITRDAEVEIATSQRSSIESSKRAAAGMVTTLFRLTGFEVEVSGDYPGWKPEPNSDLVRLAQTVHQDVLGKKPELIAMHAGLECGVIGEKHPGMQMISFGPHLVDVHSPSEKIKISSVEPFWRLLTGLLERTGE